LCNEEKLSKPGNASVPGFLLTSYNRGGSIEQKPNTGGGEMEVAGFLLGLFLVVAGIFFESLMYDQTAPASIIAGGIVMGLSLIALAIRKSQKEV
jgi:hypothetical protein